MAMWMALFGIAITFYMWGQFTKESFKLNLGYAMAYMLLSNIYCCCVSSWDFNGDVKQHKED